MAKIRLTSQGKMSPPRFHIRRRIDLSKSFLPDPQLEKKCRWLVQYMDQPVMITDDKENLLYANRKACELIGYTLPELLGRKSYNFCTPETADIMKQVIATERRAGMISTYEITMVGKSGEKIPLSVNGIPLDDGGTVGILHDLRRLKAAEEEAYKSQHYFEELFNQSSDAIAACDADEYVYDVNPAFTELFGYTPKEARGKHINDLIVPQDLIPGAINIARQVDQGRRVYLETVRQHKNGRLIHVTVTGASVTRGPMITAGKRVGVFAIYRDITERKKAEEALAESEARYALVLQGANDGLWDWNIITDKKYYSARFKELIGFKDQGITNDELQKLFPTLVDPHDYERMQRMNEAHLKFGTPYDIEYRLTLPTGETRWFRSRGQAVWDEDRRPVRMAGSIRDVTRRKVAEERLKYFNEELQSKIAEKTRHLEDANRRLLTLHELKDEFIAVTSHELRSPLTAIRGYLSFLVDPEVLKTFPEAPQKYLLRAHHNTEILSNLVNNILDVSRMEGGHFELKKTAVDLSALLRRVIDNAAIAAQDKKLKIRFSDKIGHPPLLIQADIIRIHQAFLNILDNAIKYSNRGKIIKVELRQTHDRAELRFIDQGIGISQKEIPRIFEKFMRARNMASRYRGGAGLGLYITKKIVEHHGGTIQAESRRGLGTTFIIQFPLS